MRNGSRSPELRIVSPDEVPDAVRSPVPFCMTPAAVEDALASIGTHPPETGALLYGPPDHFGVDWIDYDIRGSARASGTVYAPDDAWCTERVNHHLDANPLRLWSGTAHSHPGQYGRPSPKAGRALGDLGYVEEVFRRNPPMQFFAIPILTGTGSGRVTLWPWIAERADEGVALYLTEFRICDVSEFPLRQLNPFWEAEQEHSRKTAPQELPSNNAPSKPPLDLLDLTRRAHMPLHIVYRRSGYLLTAEAKGVFVDVTVPDGFPQTAPRVSVRNGNRAVPFRFRWQPVSALPAEHRVARLLRCALRVGQEGF